MGACACFARMPACKKKNTQITVLMHNIAQKERERERRLCLQVLGMCLYRRIHAHMDQVGKTRVFLRPCVAERLEFARARTLALVARYPVCVCVCVCLCIIYMYVACVCVCVCLCIIYMYVACTCVRVCLCIICMYNRLCVRVRVRVRACVFVCAV